jgi:hypothetical protein
VFVQAAEQIGAKGRRARNEDRPCPARFASSNWTSGDRPA